MSELVNRRDAFWGEYKANPFIHPTNKRCISAQYWNDLFAQFIIDRYDGISWTLLCARYAALTAYDGTDDLAALRHELGAMEPVYALARARRDLKRHEAELPAIALLRELCLEQCPIRRRMYQIWSDRVNSCPIQSPSPVKAPERAKAVK